MLQQISKEIKESLNSFSAEDKLIFNNKLINFNKNNFKEIKKNNEIRNIAFIDGGEAEIISAGNLCLSFIRIFGIVFKENKKAKSYKNEFYLLTKAEYFNNELYYRSKIFSENETLIDEENLFISSEDKTIKSGLERAPISKISNMVRRLAELSLASKINADFIILDGTLTPSFKNEEKYLSKLKENVSALAKSCSLFTTSGNSPIILLNKIGPAGCWNYFVDDKTSFVKLNEKAKHVFRFEGNKEVLSFLLENCCDALFLGYPYCLILTDKLARVSNAEKSSLKMKFLLNKENKEILDYLHSSDAHGILDSLG